MIFYSPRILQCHAQLNCTRPQTPGFIFVQQIVSRTCWPVPYWICLELVPSYNGHLTLLYCWSLWYTYDILACHSKFQIVAIRMAKLTTRTNCTLSDFVSLPLLLSSNTHSFFFFLDFSENDETGVMDSLLEALQSGAAFRDRRKRAPRPRGESHILSLHL